MGATDGSNGVVEVGTKWERSGDKVISCTVGIFHFNIFVVPVLGGASTRWRTIATICCSTSNVGVTVLSWHFLFFGCHLQLSVS